MAAPVSRGLTQTRCLPRGRIAQVLQKLHIIRRLWGLGEELVSGESLLGVDAERLQVQYCGCKSQS